jgi:4-amino-4-deoxy-L-arabinose transferase-like glycosyltransferase
MRHRILLAASFVYLAATNLIWIARDTRPPFWDMAYHATAALRVYDEFAERGLAALNAIPKLTGFYPPFYHIVVTVFWAVFGKSIDTARMANLPAVAIVILATYGIGKTLLSPLAAATAGVLVSFYPILLWLSRETIIDYWLTALVALAIWALLRTEQFANRRRSVEFGTVCGIGMLTKWTFPLFVVLPAIWLARRNWRNAAVAASVAAILAAWWYLPAGTLLSQFLRQNTSDAIVEGDPNPISWQAVVYYVRALEGYQLFLPLFAGFLAGLVLVLKRFDWNWIPIGLWIAGGWLGLMLFQNKDPRYSAPLLPAIALITARLVDRKQVWIAPLLVVLVFQHYAVTFGTRRIPARVVLLQGVQQTMSWNWNLYTQDYFELWGPPAHENWKIEHVLENITAGRAGPVRLGLVPDIPRFDSFAFEFYIALRKLPVTVTRLSKFDDRGILDKDYLLISERSQGFAEYFAPDVTRANDYVFGHSEKFELVERFPLPNGEVIQLHKIR